MLEWEVFDAGKPVVFLQRFCCVAPPVRKQGFRPEPHRRPWEVDVQSHLRQLSRKFRPGDLVIVGREGSDVAAVAHLQPARLGWALKVFIVAVAVSREYRGGDHHVADEMMDRIRRMATDRAIECGTRGALLYGHIDFRNESSRRLVVRAGFEPDGPPGDQCQEWRIWLPVE